MLPSRFRVQSVPSFFFFSDASICISDLILFRFLRCLSVVEEVDDDGCQVSSTLYVLSTGQGARCPLS